MGTVTISGNNYTIYGTQAEAVIYVTGLLGREATLWLATSATNQAKSLNFATKILNTLSWTGSRTDSAQALAWPRTSATDRDGTAIADSATPQDVIDGSYVLAMLLLTDPTLASRRSDKNTKKVAAGTAEIQFFRPQRIGALPKQVMDLLSPYLGGGTSSTDLALSFATGTEVESEFDYTDAYTIGDGGL